MGAFFLYEFYDIKEESEMSNVKLEKYEASVVTESLCGLVLRKGEKERLFEICVKHGIPITYPNLFTNDTHYYLWGIRKEGIGLIGTIIMNYLEDNGGKIFHSLDELEQHLNGGSL